MNGYIKILGSHLFKAGDSMKEVVSDGFKNNNSYNIGELEVYIERIIDYNIDISMQLENQKITTEEVTKKYQEALND